MVLVPTMGENCWSLHAHSQDTLRRDLEEAYHHAHTPRNVRIRLSVELNQEVKGGCYGIRMIWTLSICFLQPFFPRFFQSIKFMSRLFSLSTSLPLNPPYLPVSPFIQPSRNTRSKGTSNKGERSFSFNTITRALNRRHSSCSYETTDQT